VLGSFPPSLGRLSAPSVPGGIEPHGYLISLKDKIEFAKIVAFTDTPQQGAELRRDMSLD
jgi:hypothetical protein